MSASEVSSVADTSQEARCNTCRAVFSTIEKAKEHYRGDWHVFNSKRRGSGLVPLTKQEYKDALPMINSNKKKAVAAAPAPAPAAQKAPPSPSRVGGDKELAMGDVKPLAATIVRKTKKQPTTSEGGSEAAGTEGVDHPLPAAEGDEPGSLADPHDGSDNDEGEGESDAEEAEMLPIGANISIFDNKAFEDVDECVEYMALKFGFFIPDVEYLVDREGLLVYLGEKVKLGGLCLYCQKQLRPGYPVQAHMISKSHCKIAYEEGIDAEEFEDFYDFTASYEGLPEEYDEDGNLVEKTAQLSSIGELILPSGKVVGHRAFRLYYKQRLRPAWDNRPAVLAQQREELLRLSYARDGHRLTSDEVMRLSDTQVMSMLVRQQRDIRKSLIIEQRAAKKREIQDQRREYQSTVDKLRSRATTTAKIRDYHKTLM